MVVYTLYNLDTREGIYMTDTTGLMTTGLMTTGSNFMRLFEQVLYCGWNMTDKIVGDSELTADIDVSQFTMYNKSTMCNIQSLSKPERLQRLKEINHIQRLYQYNVQKRQEESIQTLTREIYGECTHKFERDYSEPFDSICKTSCVKCGMCELEELHKHAG
jgi:hypothetical protein